MDRQSKKELLVVVERQEEQLRRYEARLRDVVLAYKGLQKEKVALEKSLKVLSPSSEGNLEKAKLREKDKQPSTEQPRNTQILRGNKEEGTEECSSTDSPMKDGGGQCLRDNPDAQHRENDDDLMASLQDQVTTLRETLETLMEQKSKMESSFQADKKKYLQEIQTKEETFAGERDEFFKAKENMRREIEDLRNRTRLEQQARESEQNDHAMMLREMQVVVSKERSSKEGLQSKLDELNETLVDKEKQNDTPSDAEDAKGKEKENVNENVYSSPTLLQLQLEMVKMKSQLEKDILCEQLRANEAEEKASMIARAEEQRVADLEAKLSDLSDVVGKYERLRSHDQMEIQKLKERLHVLNTTNKMTADTDNRESTDNESSLGNENDLNEVFLKVKELLRSRYSQNNEEILESEVVGFSKAELECILQNDPAHKACREELRQLKDEFERYKSIAQNVRKTKVEREAECGNESTGKLREEINNLRSTVESLDQELESRESEYRINLEDVVREMTELRLKQNLELENQRTVYAAKLQELENQVRNQRSRTLSLISEKDCDIERLKGKLDQRSPSLQTPEMRRKSEMQHRRSSNADVTVNELLSQSSPTALVHYAQEQAFCEAELNLLRKQRSELEDNVREARQREEQATEQTQLLKEEIRKLERNRSRENANLEYLKNVILRYLLTDSESVRQQMVAAVAAILEFSPKELSSVKKKSKTWWAL